MENLPKWVTPERQALLAKLFVDSQGFCVFGHRPCLGQWIEHKGQSCGVAGGGCDEPQTGGLCRYHVERDRPRQACNFHKWSTLAWRCAYGHDCETPFASHYEKVAEGLVRYWQADAREQARMERRAERRIETGESGRLRGDWNETGREVFYAQQPQSYIEALGVSAVTLTPFAKVRLPSSMVNLHVDLGDSLRRLSKHKRRKVIRHGKALPPEVQREVERIVSRAVRRFWNS